MKEVLLTSSVLILALLALRRLFRKTLSRRVQYALWGLVLLRLLVPVSLPATEFSLLTAAEPVVDSMEALYVHAYRGSVRSEDGSPVMGPPNAPHFAVGPATEDDTYTYHTRDALGNRIVLQADYQRQLQLADILPPIWYGGMAVMACWLVLSNLFFWLKLRNGRILYIDCDSIYRVYLVERGLPSPCLFGLFRPAIYLTPAALASPDSLRHVLAHEETHARHWDPLWSLLRGVCLVVYWFDPLVWWAALASRTDCELACDEGALRRLGEDQRVPYGRTLLSLIPVRKAPANPLLSATTMTSDKKRLMDRIARIAENRKNLGTALFAVIALAALVCAVTFTGAKTDGPSAPAEDTALTKPRYVSADEALAALAEEFNSQGAYDITQSLTVFTPEDLPEYFSLDDGEVLRVYWTIHMSLSSNLSHPMGWLCSLYRIDKETALTEDYSDAVAMDDHNLYLLKFPSQAPELKQGETEGVVISVQVKSRIRDTLLSCEGVTRVKTKTWPDWAPIYTIPLDGLEPYEPEAVEPIPYPYDYREMLDSPEDPNHILGDYALVFFGNGYEVFAGVQHKARSSFPQPFWSFTAGVEGTYHVSWFWDLMGHKGFCITYSHLSSTQDSLSDYYYLNDDGQPVLLARTASSAQEMDLDGDGEKELVSQTFTDQELYFRRDGSYYQADLDSLLETCWPEDTLFIYETWNRDSRDLRFHALVGTYSSQLADHKTDYRTLYFDGKNLLVYNDHVHYENHMQGYYDGQSEVTEAALDTVEALYFSALAEGASYTDWRISRLGYETHFMRVDGEDYYLMEVGFEFCSPEPHETPGGWEDIWYDPFYPERTYLVFRDDAPEDGLNPDLKFMFSLRQADLPSEPEFREAKRRAALEGRIYLGTATLQATTSTMDPETAALYALGRVLDGDTVNLNLLTGQGGGRFDAAPETFDRGLRAHFTDDYDWAYAQDPGEMPAESLLVLHQGGGMSLRFWPDSGLVLFHQYKLDTWFQAEPRSPSAPGIYGLMRAWYAYAQKD